MKLLQALIQEIPAAAVNENSGAGQVVYTATAADGADTSDGFSFSLADDSLGFSIDAVFR
jgi:hypothetical protein